MPFLTASKLLDYYHQGFSDSYIGSLYEMTGEGVAYRRKKYNISLKEKSGIENYKFILYSVNKNLLAHDYYTMTQEMFSKKYNVSKAIWRPILKERNIISKTEYRSNSFPLLTQEQKILIIGSLLGDGGISKDGYFYESHNIKQRKYLGQKHNVLSPYSKKIYPVDNSTGLRFKTVQHKVFREIYKYFYKNDNKIKQIPLNLIKENWHNHILAYWFLDDGYYDDAKNELYIANAAPVKQLEKFLYFLENVFGWKFRYKKGIGINNITFSKKFYASFFKIVKEVASSDMYYKFPEEFLSPQMVSSIPTYCLIYPKFYRKAKNKLMILNRYTEELKTRNFPEPYLTDKRRKYLQKLAYKGKQLAIILRETQNPSIYDDARIKWKSDDKFIQTIAHGVLSECVRITDQNVRHIVRKLLKIKV